MEPAVPTQTGLLDLSADLVRVSLECLDAGDLAGASTTATEMQKLSSPLFFKLLRRVFPSIAEEEEAKATLLATGDCPGGHGLAAFEVPPDLPPPPMEMDPHAVFAGPLEQGSAQVVEAVDPLSLLDPLGFRCSGCGRQFPPGAAMIGCRKCNVDLCEGCQDVCNADADGVFGDLTLERTLEKAAKHRIARARKVRRCADALEAAPRPVVPITFAEVQASMATMSGLANSSVPWAEMTEEQQEQTTETVLNGMAPEQADQIEQMLSVMSPAERDHAMAMMTGGLTPEILQHAQAALAGLTSEQQLQQLQSSAAFTTLTDGLGATPEQLQQATAMLVQMQPPVPASQGVTEGKDSGEGGAASEGKEGKEGGDATQVDTSEPTPDPSDLYLFLRIRDGERLCWEGSLGPCYENGGLAADADSLTPTSLDWPDLWSVLRCIPEPFVDSAEQTAEDAVISQFRITILLERSSDGKVAKLVKDVEFIERDGEPGTPEQVHGGEIRIATGSGPPDSLELMMSVG